MIPLGAKARDTITGFTGVVVARTQWINGCVRLTLQATELKDGKPLDLLTFDEPQLALVVDEPAPAAAPAGERRGGPQPEPVRQPEIR